MSQDSNKLFTPVLLKHGADFALPEDEPVCYVLAGSGLFTHRRHQFFTSCVRSREWPAELAEQKEFLRLHCPKLSQTQMQMIVGFFSRIAKLHESEAAVLLYWDRATQQLCFEVPEQVATVTESWNGGRYATDVRYEMPTVSPERTVFGSIHSHVYGAAYSSIVDKDDESYRAGLHIVVGRIDKEPPEIHCEYVVDGSRFKVDPKIVLEGYEQRDEQVPAEWIDRVKIDLKRYRSTSTYYAGGGWGGGNSGIKSPRNGGQGKGW